MEPSANAPRPEFSRTLRILCLSLIVAASSVRGQSGTQQRVFTYTNDADLIQQLEAALRELKEAQSPELIVGAANASVPEGIRQKLKLFMGGGPNQSRCNGQAKMVAWCDAWSNQAEYYTDLIADVCVAPATENVSIVVIRPDGRSIPLPVRSSPANNVHRRATYRTKLDDPPGKYRFLAMGVTQDHNLVEASIILPKPAGPRAVWLDGEQTLQLFGFGPNERVRVFAYVDKELKGWQSYHVDPGGRLRVRILGGGDFFAVGDDSGEAMTYRPGLCVRTYERIKMN